MRTHLTRSVFRRIIANQPFTHTYCQRPPRSWIQPNVLRPHLAVQRRSFWSLFFKETDDDYFPTEYQRHLEPGMQVMEKLAEALQQQTRPPDSKALTTAFNDFLHAATGAKKKDQVRITEYYARHLLMTFNFLLEQKNAGESSEEREESDRELIKALRALAKLEVDAEASGLVAELSSKIYQVLADPSPKDQTSPATDNGLQPIPAELYVMILTLSGKSEAALSFMDRWQFRHILMQPHRLLVYVVLGLAREGKEKMAVETFDRIGPPPDKWGPAITKEWLPSAVLMLRRSAELDYTQLTKHLANYFERSELPVEPSVQTALLAFSIRTNDLGWGKQWSLKVMELATSKMFQRQVADEVWNCILLWAAANGKSSEEIEKIVTGIQGAQERVIGPSMACINELIAFANSKSNPFAAERYLAMGLRWGLSPDAETFLRQMEGRLQAGDVEGAAAYYREVDVRERLSGDRDLPALNSLLRALCTRKNDEYNLLLDILDKLLNRKNSLHSETVAALCEMFLQRGELNEATDLLRRARLDLYSKRQREMISKALFRLVVERKLKTMETWQAYDLLVKAFPEISVQDRTTIMNCFFDREQSDMASMVFGHMRQSQERKKRPTADTYVACFEGICRSPDEEALQLVHNMLKIDTHVDLSTKMLNSLMLAYMNSESPQRSLEYWDEILNSREGPTYSSIVIVLMACERAMGGGRVARVIMQRLASLEVDITPEIYAAYLGALSYHVDYPSAIEMVDKMEADVGFPPSKLIIGSIFNAIVWQEEGRGAVAQWAKEKYPDIWQDLLKVPVKPAGKWGLPCFQVTEYPKA